MATVTHTSARQAGKRIVSSLGRNRPPRGLFRQFYPVLGAIWLGTDILLAVTLLFGATLAEYGAIPTQYRVFAIFAGLTMLVVYQWSGLFFHIRMRPFFSEAEILLTSFSIVVATLVGLAYLTDTLRLLSGQLLFEWAVATYAAQLATHAIVRVCLHQARRRSMNIRRALLVGSGAPLTSFAEILRSNRWLGVKIAGFLRLDPEDASALTTTGSDIRQTGVEHVAIARAPAMDEQLSPLSTPLQAPPSEPNIERFCLGSIDDIEEVVKSRKIDQVYVTVPLEQTARVREVTQRLLKLNVDVSWVPDLSMFYLVSHGVRELDGQPILCLSESPLSTSQGPIKRLEDLVLGSVLFLLAAPLMAVIALAIKLTSPGPVLFVQSRHGLNGGVIRVWKFRTMTVHVGPEMERQARRSDPRVTRIGRFLRRWSLDELPQLIQVLQGRMSLVGPRPHPLWLNDQYTNVLLGYMQRHRVKPGLTGWAQVHGWRGETDSPVKMEMRLRHDIYYINNWSVGLDLKILAMTLLTIFRGRNAY